jgi:hypothetical protein
MLNESYNDSKSRAAGKILGSLVDQKTPLFRWRKTTGTGDTIELTIGPSFGWMIVFVAYLVIGAPTLGRIIKLFVAVLGLR